MAINDLAIGDPEPIGEGVLSVERVDDWTLVVRGVPFFSADPSGEKMAKTMAGACESLIRQLVAERCLVATAERVVEVTIRFDRAGAPLPPMG